MQQYRIGLHIYTLAHTHVADEQSQCDRRLLMTDTLLILSGANCVKRGPLRERERNSGFGGVLAVFCVVLLSLLHSFLSALFSFCFSILLYITLVALKQRLTSGLICDLERQERRSIYLQVVMLK